MCRLLGLIRTGGSANLPAWQHLVGAPNSLRIQSETGCVPSGEEAGHDDSWGIGWFDERGEVSLVRNTGSAAESAYFVFAAETAARGGAGSGPGQTILGHLRKASMGTITSITPTLSALTTGAPATACRPARTIRCCSHTTER